MYFVTINAHTQTVDVVDCPDLRDAQKLVGLGKVDHGRIARDVAIVVDEFGMFEPPEQQVYFAIGPTMFAGNAVLYGFNEARETVSLTRMPSVIFMPNAKAAERNIQLGLIERPEMGINGEVFWRWPEPPKKGMMP